MSMTLSRAIETIDKVNQCTERTKTTNCGYIYDENRYQCDGCPMYVSGKQFNAAVKTLHQFAKTIKRRCTTK